MFMGGMALGSWVVSRFTLRIRRLIAAYALAELLLAVAGFGFHPLFVAYSALNQQLILPALPRQRLVRPLAVAERRRADCAADPAAGCHLPADGQRPASPAAPQ